MTYSDTGYSIMGIHERSAAVRLIEMVQDEIIESIPFTAENIEYEREKGSQPYYIELMQENIERDMVKWTTLENARLLLTGEASE